jgi:MFS family permease
VRHDSQLREGEGQEHADGRRVLQGLGGGLIMRVGMSVLAQTAGPQRIGRVMSVIGVPMLLGPVLGPVIGGLIVTNASWRWIFYVNVPIAAAALVLAGRLLRPDTGRPTPGGSTGSAWRRSRPAWPHLSSACRRPRATFAWAAVLSLVSLVPALLLAGAQTGRRNREPRVSQGAVAVGQ